MRRAIGAFVAAVAVVLAGANPPVTGAQEKAPAPVVCTPRGQAAAPYESAVAAEPNSVIRHIALAQCYDTAWRFGEAEREIVRTLELVREEAAHAAAPADPDAPIYAGVDVRMPGLRQSALAEFPKNAAEAGARGVVAVEARVDPRGRVKETRVVESVPLFDVPAVRAVKQLQFEPTLVNGKPVEVSVLYFVRFGVPTEQMPADWLDTARVYWTQKLYRHAVAPLEAALARTRRDLMRFQGSGRGPIARIDPSITPPTKIRGVAPRYPLIAQQLKIQGVVILEGLIDQFGDVGRARVLRSVPMLDAAAVDAVLNWGYTPAQTDGKPVMCVMTVTVTFTLQ